MFGSIPIAADVDVLVGVWRPCTLPTPTVEPEPFPDVTVITGFSDEGEGIAGGGFDVTYCKEYKNICHFLNTAANHIKAQEWS